MCIATRCTSVEQFIQMFHRFVDEESFFVSTLNTRPPGLETSFSVQLVDGTPVLRGLCTVMQSWTDGQNPFKTPGVRLGIKRLTANSMVVFEQLLIARTTAKAPVIVNAPVAPASPPPLPPKPIVAPPKQIAVGKPSATPQVVVPVVTKPGGLVAPKLPAIAAIAAPKAIAKSPFSETAPTRSAPSRLELKQPARAASEPATRVVPPRAVSEPIPVAIPSEPTDVTEEKTDVREPKPAAARVEARDIARDDTRDIARDDKRDIAGDDKRDYADLEIHPAPALDDKRGDDSTAKPPAKIESPASLAAETDLPTPQPDDSRTPGSDLVLPANPLQNLTDESLEGYVDCTLYEETGNFFPAEDDPAAEVDDPVIPPPVLVPRPAVSRTLTPIPYEPRQRTITPLPAAPDDGQPDGELAAKRLESAPKPGYESPDESLAVPRDSSSLVAPPLPAPPKPPDSVVVDPALIARGSTPAVESAGGLKSQGLPLPAPALSSTGLAPHRDNRRWWLLGSAVGVLAAAAVLVVITTSSSDGRNPTKPAQKPAPAAKEVAQLTPPVGDSKPGDQNTEQGDEPPDEPEPPPGNGPPMVGAGPCKVVVNSTPAGSIVQLDGQSVGPSPLTVAATCDKHKLEIAHARYQPVTKLVSLSEGKPEQIEVTLLRPTHIVTVTSNPSGAQILIDGRNAGTTPTKLSVLGFTTLKIEFKKIGYQPASTKLYSRVAQDNVAIKLVKW